VFHLLSIERTKLEKYLLIWYFIFMSELYPFSVIYPPDKVIGAIAHDIDEANPGVISNVPRAVYALDRIAADGTDGPDVSVIKENPTDKYSLGIKGVTFHNPNNLLQSEQLLGIRAIGPSSLKVLHEFASAATAQAILFEPVTSEQALNG
jgi:hypothetical protein